MSTSLKNISTLIGGILSLYISYLTVTGTLQEYINFSDPLNEMAFFICAFGIGVSCIYCGIPQRHWNKANPFKS